MLAPSRIAEGTRFGLRVATRVRSSAMNSAVPTTRTASQAWRRVDVDVDTVVESVVDTGSPPSGAGPPPRLHQIAARGKALRRAPQPLPFVRGGLRPFRRVDRGPSRVARGRRAGYASGTRK